MFTVALLFIWLLDVFLVLLMLRIIVEMIQSFSRNFRPPRWFAIAAEPLFIVTDPPVKAVRRVIPPLRLGAVALDLSIIVLFFAVQFIQIGLRFVIR